MADDSKPGDDAATSPASAEKPVPACVDREDLAFFAHELRGALTVISGYSDMLRRPLHDAERFAALEGIRRAVRRADALCTNVLTGKTSESRKAPRAPVQLWALAEHVAAEQRASTGRTITVDAPEDMAVLGDEHALERVLTNLVNNAAKYSPAETVIQIHVRRELTPDFGATAVVEVCDRGPGIPADERERLLQPFERLDRDADIQGTGLGLAVVQSVVEAHGGSLRIGDHAGGGTVMRVELPVTH